MREYIHPYERSLERELCLLNEGPAISKENRELMLGFYRHNQLNNISIPRLVKQLGTLRLVADFIKKSFLEVKDATFDELGCKLTLDGKTGMRQIRIVNAAAELPEWLNKHARNVWRLKRRTRYQI